MAKSMGPTSSGTTMVEEQPKMVSFTAEYKGMSIRVDDDIEFYDNFKKEQSEDLITLLQFVDKKIKEEM